MPKFKLGDNVVIKSCGNVFSSWVKNNLDLMVYLHRYKPRNVAPHSYSNTSILLNSFYHTSQDFVLRKELKWKIRYILYKKDDVKFPYHTVKGYLYIISSNKNDALLIDECGIEITE